MQKRASFASRVNRSASAENIWRSFPPGGTPGKEVKLIGKKEGHKKSLQKTRPMKRRENRRKGRKRKEGEEPLWLCHRGVEKEKAPKKKKRITKSARERKKSSAEDGEGRGST